MSKWACSPLRLRGAVAGDMCRPLGRWRYTLKGAGEVFSVVRPEMSGARARSFHAQLISEVPLEIAR